MMKIYRSNISFSRIITSYITVTGAEAGAVAVAVAVAGAGAGAVAGAVAVAVAVAGADAVTISIRTWKHYLNLMHRPPLKAALASGLVILGVDSPGINSIFKSDLALP